MFFTVEESRPAQPWQHARAHCILSLAAVGSGLRTHMLIHGSMRVHNAASHLQLREVGCVHPAIHIRCSCAHDEPAVLPVHSGRLILQHGGQATSLTGSLGRHIGQAH